ncbi:ABC transporter ATP-binding protein [Kutzneria kofuensis]|uniref:ATP-binding cassette subfamily B protein n=1 Tax=Kutzneria kofuensis TaxID=103725 RepID=A0A7W9KP15_9PSEU|nr:ABC transporter ATP-binding protein [Kutzneria kofuensis]MBB5896081.1 ATP-binding cassette subfamily B protein [Kutzneria kofuensis]
MTAGILTRGVDVLSALRLAAQAAASANRRLAVGVGVLAVVGSALTVAVALVSQEIVDSATTGQAVLLAAGLFGAYAIATLCLEWLNTGLTTTLAEATDHWLESTLARCVLAPPGLDHVENSEYQNQVHVLLNQRGALGGTVNTVVGATTLAVRFVVAEVLLARISPVLLVFPLFIVPTIAISGRTQRLLSRSLTAVAERTRLATMFFQTASDPAAGRELRVYGLGPEVVRRHTDLLLEVDEEQWAARLKSSLLEGATWAFFAAGLVGAIFFAVHDGRAQHSPAELLLLFVLAAQIAGQTKTASFVVGSIGRQTDAFRRYRHVRDVADRYRGSSADAPAPDRLEHGIDLVDVELRYAGASEPALRGVSCHLPAGATVALVGPSGAGKSSLVKLLLGLYEPTAGSVNVDGVPLSAIDHGRWRERTAAAFQDFTRFELTLLESVGVGDLPRSTDEVAVAGALRRAEAGSLVQHWDDGLQTRLGRSHADGVEPSEGQWQKVAIARAMLRDAPLLTVLDEPTASLDAESEYDLFHAYRRSARDRAHRTGGITVLVSHRFVTVRDADLILVIDGGRVVESGTHDELVRLGGRYARLFETQAGEYR